MRYPDIYFTKEYSLLFKDTAFGGEPCHFYFAGIDYRFYKRQVFDTPYFDIVSPYGYSGPVPVDFPADWPDFIAEFHKYCVANSIIAEFARFHPFIQQQNDIRDFVDGLFYEHDIFYIDLTQSEAEIWKGFDKGCKSAIKKSHEYIMLNNTYHQFKELYKASMIGKQRESYLFTNRFWELIMQAGQLFMGLESGAIVLKYDDYCHYFLATGGNQNLILWEAIKWAKYQGCKIFNLGGGLKAGDSLESFKRSFTKTSKPFYTYRKIHNQEVYNQLCQAKGVQPDLEGYFPAYRRI